jgi:uncharacterized RDD family membrane protein YckC
MEIAPETPPHQTEGEHLLDDIGYTLYQAASGKRLANYLIDYAIFYLTYRFLLFNPAVSLLILVRQYSHSSAAVYIGAYLLAYIWSFALKAAFETFTGGKTIAKFITRTRAVNEDGSRITAKTAVLRSLSRWVPFEVFSALGSPCYPWHDRWTKTYVVDERISSLPDPQR